MQSAQSIVFENIFKYLKIFGIWPGQIPSRYYKYYSIFYLFTTFVCYNVLLTMNLIYTPRKIELLLREVIFYFTEIVVASKVLTVLLMRNKIIEAIDIIDSDEFLGDYESEDGLLSKVYKYYKFGWRLYIGFTSIALSSLIFVPIFLDIIRETESELPICKYYFLSEENRRSFFLFWFMYQSFGMYSHMIYNVNIDTFVVGLLIIAIAQLRFLNVKFRNLKLSKVDNTLSKESQDKNLITRLNSCFRHYDSILKFRNTIQSIVSAILFVQFGVASITICVVMCGLLLPATLETRVFMVMYLFAMTTQIFVPGYVGTQLTNESYELVCAAYNSEWIPRSESFKRSLKLFMERTKSPVTITGLKIFPLSLSTFSSIMRTAYSMFTLIRKLQEE